MPDLKFKPHRARLRHRALQEPQRLFFIAVPVGLVIASVALFALAGVAAWPAILFLLLLYLLAGRRLMHPRNRAARHHGGGGAALPRLPLTRLPLNRLITQGVHSTHATGRSGALFCIEIDDFATLRHHHGLAGTRRIAHQLSLRLRSAVRENDPITRISPGRFAIWLDLGHSATLGSSIRVGSRLRSVAETPITLGHARVKISCSVGLCYLGAQPNRLDAAHVLAMAERALAQARQSGPAGLGMHAAGTHPKSISLAQRQVEAKNALEGGEIRPWFQPQICTTTGRVSGFEALARWHHPARGILGPSEFLGTLAQCQGLEALTESMLGQALAALRSWDEAGATVPQIVVNFTQADLQNPLFTDRVQWQLGLYGIAPQRLAIEVLETAITGAVDQTISRNINRVEALGCRISLDDFGTGPAPISLFQTCPLAQLKIDRALIRAIPERPRQQKMVSAIVKMAGPLEIDTIAEGVETPAEQAMVARLGCTHIQGYAIAHPMPFDKTLPWLWRYNARRARLPAHSDPKRKTG